MQIWTTKKNPIKTSSLAFDTLSRRNLGASAVSIFPSASQISYLREFWPQNKEFLDLKTSQKLADSFLVKVQSLGIKMA